MLSLRSNWVIEGKKCRPFRVCLCPMLDAVPASVMISRDRPTEQNTLAPGTTVASKSLSDNYARRNIYCSHFGRHSQSINNSDYLRMQAQRMASINIIILVLSFLVSTRSSPGGHGLHPLFHLWFVSDTNFPICLPLWCIPSCVLLSLNHPVVCLPSSSPFQLPRGAFSFDTCDFNVERASPFCTGASRWAKYIYETIGILETKNPFRTIFRPHKNSPAIHCTLSSLSFWHRELGRHPISSLIPVPPAF